MTRNPAVQLPAAGIAIELMQHRHPNGRNCPRYCYMFVLQQLQQCFGLQVASGQNLFASVHGGGIRKAP